MRDWPGEDDDRAQTLLLGGWLALRRQRNDDARKIFGRLVRDFPKSPAARKARQLLESLEAR
jgi:TolA-binding protein